MKSLLNKKGTLLDNAPSFLLRQKSSVPLRSNPLAPTLHDHAPSANEPVPITLAPRVTPLRPMSALSQRAAASALQAAQVAEVEWLLQQSLLTTFRSFQSFAYSATLLFYPRDLTYYAVLYHEDAVWRVLRASDIDTAEPAFRHFVDHAMRLAEAEMRRAHLAAQNEQLARLIADAEAQVDRARVDIERGAVRDKDVSAKQQELRRELAQLEARRVQAEVQLGKLHRQLHTLDASCNESVPHLSTNR